MRYKPDWDKVSTRYEAYWARENHDRPLLSVTAPAARQTAEPLPRCAALKERWLDIDYMLAAAHRRFQNTYYGAEALPVLSPDLGPDLFAALYGTPIEFGEDTSWAVHNLKDWDEYQPLVLDKNSPYYRKICEMTRAAAEDGRGQYLVGVTDIHAGLDGLVSMRGPELLCMDALERPEFLARGAMDLFEGFKTLYTGLQDIAGQHQAGSTNWMNIWHPSRWYVTSCDFICLISPAMFDDLVVEELEAQLAFLDASIFHLDGPDALRHLDRLLELDALQGIQWVYGAGQPTAAHWLEVLQKIQKAGKCFQIDATPADMPVLLDNLAPEGALYVVRAESEEEARAIEKLAGV